jgi:predicted DCC family thiol-disulfide oxidoreductase YuxK
MNSELTEKTDIKEASSTQRHPARPRKGPHPGLLPVQPLPPKDAESAASFRGWILYDGACQSCTASARRFDRIFRHRGFLFLPLQTEWVRQQLGLEAGAPLEEMHVLTNEGQDIAGVDAILFLARRVWWTWPVVAFAQLPGMHKLLDRGYRWIAAHRGCDHIKCGVAFATLTLRHAEVMAARERIARSLCAFIAVFWGARLFVQFAIFDARPFLTNWIYRVGYHVLTVIFAFLVLVYGKAAI